MMERNFVKVLVCLVVSVLCAVDASSPVVLWTLKRTGVGHVESNLNEFSSQQFADLLAWKTEQGNIPIIAFGLDALSLEDLTPQGGMGSSEPFRKLRKITDASAETLLFPAVQSATESISVLQSKGYQVYKINAGDALPTLESPNSILVISENVGVNMDDEVLRVFSKYTLDYPNIVGMLWGKRSTWTEEPEDEVNDILSRRKRQAAEPKQNGSDPFSFNDKKGLFLVFRSVVLTVFHQQDKNSVSFSQATITTAANGSDITTMTMSFPNVKKGVSTTKFDVIFNLEKGKMGYWKMKGATASLTGSDIKSFTFDNVRLSSAIDLTVPTHLSFHCSRFGSFYPTDRMEDTKQNHTFTIDFVGFQMQAFMPDRTEDVFADSYECVGFFTIGIWSGIFVTIILISILTWGLKMLMDVKTMDRFDDPKGKPVSFGGTE